MPARYPIILASFAALLVSLTAAIPTSISNPERYYSLLQSDPELANTIDEIFARAEVWKRTGGFSNPENRRAARQVAVNVTAPPILFSPNPDPNPFVIPPGAPTIRVGRTWPQSPGNPETPFGLNAEQGFRTGERIFNSLGGMMYRGQQTYLEYITYNDGGDPALMPLLYERLITVDGAVFLQTPVHYIGSIVALVAEAYEIPLINTCDYTLPILMDSDPAYMNLKWTWDLASNYFTAGEACVKAIYDSGARSLVSFEVPESPFFADQAINAARALNMAVPFNKTVFSIADAIASYRNRGNPNNCSYFDPFIDQLIAADPDILYGSALTETEQLMNCIYRRKYRPRALVITVGAPGPRSPTFWKSVGLLAQNTWVNGANYADPFIPSQDYYVDLYDEMWNTGDRSLGYQASHFVGTALGLYCIQQSNSTDPALIGACLTALNISTILGRLYLLNGTRHYVRPYICQQILDLNNTLAIVYPPDYVDVVPVVYPWSMLNFFPKAFLDSLKEPTGISRRDRTLIITFTVVFGVLLLAGFIGYKVLRARYHTVFIAKGNNQGGADWDDKSSEREVMQRLLPCLRC